MGSFVQLGMFRGATKVTLDAKGRMAIPVRHRERLAARGDGQVVCTVDPDYCLLLYPLPDWEEIERKIMRLPSFQVGIVGRGALEQPAGRVAGGYGR